MNENILTLDNLSQTAQEIIKKVEQKENERATVIAFYGDLGTGKTTLTKVVAKQLGVKEKIISPTFVIMKIYKTKNKKFKKLIHIDSYRLKNSQELLALGWEDIIKDKSNFIIVEWPERTPELFLDNCHKLNLEHKNETTRTIKIEYN
jgi:tRNA threonylcarbamoyladenosine biosynthesis protein TsaE